MFGRAILETPCTVSVEHTNEELSAHVELDGDPVIAPGDQVRVHGPPIQVAFGERIRVRRLATVHRAGLFERVWTRLSSRLELAELYEVSFSPRRSL